MKIKSKQALLSKMFVIKKKMTPFCKQVNSQGFITTEVQGNSHDNKNEFEVEYGY